MRQALPSAAVSAPSSNLLRFLRSQSDNVCFTAHARRPLCAKKSDRPRSLHSFYVSIPEPLYGPSHRSAIAKCSFVDLAFLYPRFALNRSSLRPSLLSSKQKQEAYHFLGRSFSSSGRAAADIHPSWLQRMGLTGGGKTQTSPLTSARYLDDTGGDGALPNYGRTVSAKATNEMKLRCTEFDENGKVTLVNGEFKKSELIQKVDTRD